MSEECASHIHVARSVMVLACLPDKRHARAAAVKNQQRCEHCISIDVPLSVLK